MNTETRDPRVGPGGAGRVSSWLLVLVLGAAACTGRAPAGPAPSPEGDTPAEGRAEPAPGGGEPADTAVQPRPIPGLPPVGDTISPEDGAADGASDPAVDPPGESGPPSAGSATPDATPLVPAEPPVPILPGALLPRTRIVAFYGNPASGRMGILGAVPPDSMLALLDREVEAWEAADPATPVIPALHLITVMATGDPGRDSLYRLPLSSTRIQQVEEWAARRNALLFLDIQPGRSTVAAELPRFEGWLAQPHVHLALDPEWAMGPDELPGRVVGSMTADDINFAVDYLADLVDRYSLPPKVLVVHRFTSSMIQDAMEIRRDPRVQVVINMDGWGTPPQKRAAYRDVVAPEADQFTGFKLFFINDTREGSRLLTPGEVLELDPHPVYIQYQ